MHPIVLFLGIFALAVLLSQLLAGSGGLSPSLAKKRLKALSDLDQAVSDGETSLRKSGSQERSTAWHGGSKKFMKKKSLFESSFLKGVSAKKKLMVLVGFMIASGVILYLASQGKIPGQAQMFLPIGVAVLVFPSIIGRLRLGRIRKKFSEQFPAAIRMMVNALRAGHDIRTSFEMVSEDMPSPIRDEFAHILSELNVGISLERGLMNFDRRMKMNDVKIFVLGILLNNKLGGNLTEILGKLLSVNPKRLCQPGPHTLGLRYGTGQHIQFFHLASHGHSLHGPVQVKTGIDLGQQLLQLNFQGIFLVRFLCDNFTQHGRKSHAGF